MFKSITGKTEKTIVETFRADGTKWVYVTYNFYLFTFILLAVKYQCSGFFSLQDTEIICSVCPMCLQPRFAYLRFSCDRILKDSLLSFKYLHCRLVFVEQLFLLNIPQSLLL